MIRTGNADSGLTRLRQTLADSLEFEQKQVALLALNSIGKAQLNAGEFKTAKKAFEKAVSLTENSLAPLTGEEFRIAFLDGKLEPFEQLAAISLSENKTAQALAYIESAKSRSLLEAVQSGSTAADRLGDFSAEASTAASVLREELNWFYSRLRTTTSAEAEKIKAEIKRRERKFSDLLRRRQSLANTDSAERRGQPASFDIDGLCKTLGPDRALIEYVKLDGKLSAFVITSERIDFVADLATEKAVIDELEQLRFQFGTLRFGRQALSAFASQLKQRADSALARLHEMLVGPVEPFIGGKDLVIVPSGIVHYVPFSALKNSFGYLTQTCNISTAPSASIWQALVSRPLPRPKNPLLIAFADQAAPEVENEVKAIAKIMPSARTFSGRDATFANFRENAGRHDLIHIACHGHFRADNPLYSSLQLADGHINVRDISSRRLKAGVVVLSACETGLSKLFPGEEIIGLARGFLSAGVRSLVLSLWTVDDAATRRFMTEFYSYLQRGESVEASLRQTQAKFIEEGEHPYYWSPFFSIG
ncbi:MAG: CHAT domain-containing protein [Acidobacteria bacterium]|nr:CHAT domain-containing protein [Acidobacteriota bacterium]